MKLMRNLERAFLCMIVICALPEITKAADDKALPASLTEMSAEEISELDVTTLFARYKAELNSPDLSREQKDAARMVMMRSLPPVQTESKGHVWTWRTLMIVSVGILGRFIRRWYRSLFS